MEEQKRNTNQEKYMQGLGVTSDPIANVTKDEMLGELRHDVEAYEKALEDAKKNLANYTEQVELDMKMWDILAKPGAIRKIRPERFFEEDPLYWELAEKKQSYKIREDRALTEGQIRQLENVISNTEEALKNAKAKLAKFSEA